MELVSAKKLNINMDNSKIEIFENFCRTCMREQHTEVTATRKKTKSFISIYKEHKTKDTGNINIMQLLLQTSPQLTIETDDMLPKMICKNCLDMLGVLHEFQRKTLRVEQRLRDLAKEYYPLHEVDVDPLNYNTIQQDECGEDLNIEIDEPLTDVTASVYPGSEKCDTDDDVGFNLKAQFDTSASFSEARNNGNDNLFNVMFWKYIDGDYQDAIPVMEEHSSKDEEFDNGEVNSDQHKHDRKGKRLDKKSRKSNREVTTAEELPNESYKGRQKSDNDDIDSELRYQTTINYNFNCDMKDLTEEESLESELSDCNEIGVDDNSEWEPPLNKSERFKCKSMKNASKIERDQQDTLNLKNKDTKVITAELDTRIYPCNKCGIRLKTPLSLKRHLKRHLKQHSPEKGHICPECGARLKTQTTLRRHLLMHEKDETKIKYKCQYCNKAVSSSSSLRSHLRTHTGERPYLCSVCGKSFSTAYSLDLHSHVHGTEYNIQCPECPKKFRCASNMYTHKAIVHSTARPHVCDVCGSSFKKPYGLRKHKINHGEKKHKCDYCEAKFAQPDQCRQHMRRHTGEKPYKCRYCERSYSQSYEVMKHLRVHLGDNVYRCDLCPKAFRMLCEMRIHFISHKDDDEETKFQNLQALQEAEERIQAKVKRKKATE